MNNAKIFCVGLHKTATSSLEVAGHKAVRFEFRTDQKPIVREGRKFSFAVADLEAIRAKKQADF